MGSKEEGPPPYSELYEDRERAPPYPTPSTTLSVISPHVSPFASQNPTQFTYLENPAAQFTPAKETGLYGWWLRRKQHQPQSQSISSVSMVFISGGMCMAWSLGFAVPGFALTKHIHVAWFLGGMLGAIVGATLSNHLRKLVHALIALLLVIISGYMFLRYSQSYYTNLCGLYINGFANGLAFVTCLVMAGEEVVKEKRGLFISGAEAQCYAMGMVIQVFLLLTMRRDRIRSINPTEMLGLLHIVYGAFGMLFAYYKIIETPVWYLKRELEQLAVDSLCRLQFPHSMTEDTVEQLNELKHYVTINKTMTFAQSAYAGMPVLLKICIFRGLTTLSISILVNYGLMLSLKDTIFSYEWMLIPYMLLRYLGALISGLVLESAGRKNALLFGLFFSGGLSLAIGSMQMSTMGSDDPSRMMIIITLFLAYQFFAGFCTSPTSAYLTEAFPLAVKPSYIAITFMVECLLQIIVVFSFYHSGAITPDFMITLGVFSIGSFILGFCWLPETKRTSMPDAQLKFEKSVK